MRHVFLCLVVPLVLACGSGPFEPYRSGFRLEGTVTAADDGSPIGGANLKLWVPTGVLTSKIIITVVTEPSGRYLVFLDPENSSFRVNVYAVGFFSQFLYSSDARYEDGARILDVQLERIPTQGPTGG